MNSIIITQSNYIPWKGYFSIMREATHFVVYDDMQYTKRDWRNRNKLITPDGPKWLSIPIDVKGKFDQKINEAIVSDDNWGKKHWNFIENNYKKSKYFEEYSEYFKPLFLDPDSNNLSEINLSFLEKSLQLLMIDVQIISSSEFNLNGDKTERLLNICRDLEARTYLTGPAAKNYLDSSKFSAHGVEVKYTNYSGFPVYKQLWDQFSHEVSILDMFFNLGPMTLDYFN